MKKYSFFFTTSCLVMSNRSSYSYVFKKKHVSSIKKSLFAGVLAASLGYATIAVGMNEDERSPASRLTPIPAGKVGVSKNVWEVFIQLDENPARFTPEIRVQSGLPTNLSPQQRETACLKGIREIAASKLPGVLFTEKDFKNTFTMFDPSITHEERKTIICGRPQTENHKALILYNASFGFKAEVCGIKENSNLLQTAHERHKKEQQMQAIPDQNENWVLRHSKLSVTRL